MFQSKSLGVVLPTYNERDSIADVIRGFEALGIVDDILVVNNNAAPGTSEAVFETSAREVFEPVQGYGAAIQRGLRECKTDLVCVCEPDGTFDPQDLLKLLPFTSECSVVLGSRTVSAFIWSGANMGRFLRWGNWAVAKLVEILFNTPYLSDVGCTMRILDRSAIETIEPGFTVRTSHFGLELILLVALTRLTFVQVPVKYLERVGTSSVTGDFYKALSLGLRMIHMTLYMRLKARSIRQALHAR